MAAVRLCAHGTVSRRMVNIRGRGDGAEDDGWRPESRRSQRGGKGTETEIFQRARGGAVSRDALINQRRQPRRSAGHSRRRGGA